MKKAIVLIAFLLPIMAPTASACSCFGPQTFCGTLDPPFTNPEWWIPDAIVLGVKTAQVAHGMDIRIVSSFTGPFLPDDVVRVWGDNGILCRMYTEAWAVGDTVVWGIKHTDMAGGPLEQADDYHLSVCGVYWLDYANGAVSGPITSETVTSIPIEELMDVVNGCLASGLPERTDPIGIVVTSSFEGLTIRTSGDWIGTKQVRLMDAAGRVVHESSMQGNTIILTMEFRETQMLLVQVSDPRHSVLRKVLRE